MATNVINEQIIKEGLASVKTFGNVFYNPVQEFNRDLSISVLSVFAEEYPTSGDKKEEKGKNKSDTQVKFSSDEGDNPRQAGVVYRDGVTILEALAASGLRSVRYAKEVAGVKKIIANDISKKAVESIRANITSNCVDEIVEISHSDAIMYMYSHRQQHQFDAIDLDPYGCPSTFLDAAVQAVAEGGLLLVTATDMAVLAGNSPETCHVKYGSVSLRMKACHEMALRILLRCIESHANRYGRFIVPLLSLSADFYIRVFVKVYSGAVKCKLTTSKLSMVYHCTGCGSFSLQPLGVIKSADGSRHVKFGLPTGPVAGPNCEHCTHRHHMGGPIWTGPLHCKDFVYKILKTAPEHLGTWKRIQGVLSVIAEELDDVPLYYTLERLSATLHCETPPMLLIRSAILNAGYRVSFTHTNRTSIKTDAPGYVVWDILRCWEKKHPVKRERLSEGSPGACILAKEPIFQANFEFHVDANPESRRQGYVRFQENPTSHWGPGTRATAMVGEEKISKSKKNQNKRKRDKSDESIVDDSKKLETDTTANI